MQLGIPLLAVGVKHVIIGNTSLPHYSAPTAGSHGALLEVNRRFYTDTRLYKYTHLYAHTWVRAHAHIHTKIYTKMSFFLYTLELICNCLPVCKWDLKKRSCTEKPEPVHLVCLRPTLCRLHCCSAMCSGLATRSVLVFFFSVCVFPFLQNLCGRGSPQLKPRAGSSLLSSTIIWTEAQKSARAFRMDGWRLDYVQIY